MGRAPCCDKNGLKKGPWTPEEDQKLIDYIEKHGHGSWRTLPKNAGLERCGKSCRLRWANYLRPDIKRGRFSFEEEETIIQLHSVLGNKWSAIAARLPGRTDNEIKNYWNTHIRKRLLKMGIDPVTHTPRLDLLDISSILRTSLCSYSSSQLNISRLLGIQPLSIHPEQLIRQLATTILSSSQHEIKPEFQLMQNIQQNQLCNINHPAQIGQNNQFPLSFQPNNFDDDQSQTIQENIPPNCTGSSIINTTTPNIYVPFSNDHETQQIQHYSNVGTGAGQYLTQSNQAITNCNLSNSQTNYPCQQNGSNLLMGNFTHHDHHLSNNNINQGYEIDDDQFILNCLSENSNFTSNGGGSGSGSGYNEVPNNNFSFGSSSSSSVLSSTPNSSTHTPLNSSTTCINSSSSSTEDEKDSYCSDMLKLEFPDTLDINEYFL